jgi:hypothetical protein
MHGRAAFGGRSSLRTIVRAMSCAVIVFDACGTALAQTCGDADANGAVTVTDGVLTLAAAAGLPSSCSPVVCDLDGNGSVTVSDGVNVLRLAAGLAALAGCPIPSPGADPAIGCYVLDRRGCFAVRFENPDAPDPSRKVVAFAADCASATPADACRSGCFRSDAFPVIDGRFSHRHGEIGGTDCPTDGYAISGAFVTPTEAAGTIEYSADCRVIAALSFVAIIPATPRPTPTAVAVSAFEPGPSATIGGGGGVLCLAPPP